MLNKITFVTNLKTKMNKKQNKKTEAKPKEPEVERVVSGDSVYNNCTFYQIDSANIIGNKPVHTNVSEEEVKDVQMKIVQFVSQSTGYPQEMVERILEQAEKFMRDNY